MIALSGMGELNMQHGGQSLIRLAAFEKGLMQHYQKYVKDVEIEELRQVYARYVREAQTRIEELEKLKKKYCHT